MKAIFIDTFNHTVTEIQIENALHAFYEKIGCRLVQMLDIGEGHALCVDEEGKLRDWKAGFCLAGSPTLAGNALIVGTTDDGDFADCRAPLCLFKRKVEFIDLRAHPLPPLRFVTVPIEGCITVENIEKTTLWGGQGRNGYSRFSPFEKGVSLSFHKWLEHRDFTMKK